MALLSSFSGLDVNEPLETNVAMGPDHALWNGPDWSDLVPDFSLSVPRIKMGPNKILSWSPALHYKCAPDELNTPRGE